MEAEAVISIPDAPADFNEEHKRKWDEVCGLLMQYGLLTNCDLDAVRRYVEADITAKVTYAILIAEGFVVDAKKHPLHMVYAEAVKTQRAIWDQFGLTPLARTRVKVQTDAPREKSFFEKLMEEVNALD
jgi:P27 family predicted phage terminase small subunit